MFTIGMRNRTIHQSGLPATLSRTIVFQIGTNACQVGSPAFLKIPNSANAPIR